MKYYVLISFSLFQAYRLKKCLPPPAVENGEVIYEDEDFHIGKNLRSHGNCISKESPNASEWQINKVMGCISEPKKVRQTVQPSTGLFGFTDRGLISAFWWLWTEGRHQIEDQHRFSS